MSVDVVAYLEICPECAIWVANCDLSSLDNLRDDERDERYREVVAGVARMEWVLGGPSGYLCLAGGDENGEPWFSDLSCDTCGALPGDREAAVILSETAP